MCIIIISHNNITVITSYTLLQTSYVIFIQPRPFRKHKYLSNDGQVKVCINLNFLYFIVIAASDNLLQNNSIKIEKRVTSYIMFK